MLLSSSNRQYPHFPLLSYFSVVMCLRCLIHHILLLIAYTFRENREFVFIIFVQFLMSVNNWIHFVLKIVFACLYITPSHYHHCANLSEDIEFIKCLSDIFCRVCEKDQAYSLSYPLYNTRGCVFSVYPFSCDDWEDIYTLSYCYHQIGSMNHYPLFRVRSWNNGARCMSFCILIKHTLACNKTVDHSDVGAAPTTFSFSTKHLFSIDWVETTARRGENHWRFGIRCHLY